MLHLVIHMKKENLGEKIKPCLFYLLCRHSQCHFQKDIQIVKCNPDFPNILIQLLTFEILIGMHNTFWFCQRVIIFKCSVF